MQASKRNTLIVIAVVLFNLVNVQAQMKARANKDDGNSSTQLYAIEDVRPGMKGVARTVFAGKDPEEFGLEILGVLDGFTGPRNSTIIARLSGPNVARKCSTSGAKHSRASRSWL